jgi:hypothetical protein
MARAHPAAGDVQGRCTPCNAAVVAVSVADMAEILPSRSRYVVVIRVHHGGEPAASRAAAA